MKFLVLCFLLAAGTCLAGVYRHNIYSSFYNSLPDDLKNPFISYELALAVVKEDGSSEEESHHSTENLLSPEGLGVPEEIFHALEELNPPRGCSQHIYELAREHLGLGFSKIIILIKKGLVCQNGHCYDLGDVGSNL